MATKLLKLPGPLGMFAAVNEVICQLHLAQERGYEFVVDWRQSAYADPTREGDPWEYFFEPCFPHADWRASETLRTPAT